MNDPTDFTAYDRAAEVEALLAADETVLGRLWAYEQEGLSPQEMADREGTVNSGWVSIYRGLVRVLRDGEVPTAPTVAQGAARRVRAWLKAKDLSDQLRAELEAQERAIESRAADRQAQSEEVAEAVRTTRQAEASGPPGIYVYTLPHYLLHRYEPDSGRTLLKVGHSSVGAVYRASSQGRLTALPEDPVLLRIYPVDASRDAEREFHAWLRDADHPGSRTMRGGSEWYVTSTKFLDRVARSMGLEVRAYKEMDVGDE